MWIANSVGRRRRPHCYPITASRAIIRGEFKLGTGESGRRPRSLINRWTTAPASTDYDIICISVTNCHLFCARICTFAIPTVVEPVSLTYWLLHSLHALANVSACERESIAGVSEWQFRARGRETTFCVCQFWWNTSWWNSFLFSFCVPKTNAYAIISAVFYECNFMYEISTFVAKHSILPIKIKFRLKKDVSIPYFKYFTQGYSNYEK